MSTALYANKFTLEINDMARIVFIDERPPITEGLPMASTTIAQIVMTIPNLESLGDIITQIVRKQKEGRK
jgi:hypothetical protein